MHDSDTKARVLEVFLEFVRGYIPLNKAMLATLGGTGLEAKLWQARGIPGEHGWIVERGRQRSLALIRARFPYRYTARLLTFPRVLRAIHGVDAAVDGFHLDLCGTVEPNLAEFRPMMPLIVGSHGRSLAITVTEHRQNRSLREYEQIEDWGERLLGREPYAQFLAQLEALQAAVPRSAPARFAPADPVKCARREFGFFFHFLTLMGMVGKGLIAVPDKMERYVYVSRWSGHPFRMRTYVFHFESVPDEGEWRDPRVRARALLAVWRESRLTYVDRDGNMEPVRVARYAPPVSKTRKEETIVAEQTTAVERMRRIIGAVGGDLPEAFDAIVARAAQADELERAVGEAQVRLKNARYALDGGAAPARPRTPLEVETGVPDFYEPKPPKRGRKPAAAQAASRAGAKNGDVIAVQLDLLRAAASGRLKVAYSAAAKALGVSGKKGWRYTVGATWARTQGGFRGDFVMRATRGMDQAARGKLMIELARLYTQIGGKSVSVADLGREVAAAERQAAHHAKRMAALSRKRHKQ